MPRISVGSGIEYQRILKKTNTYGGKEVGIGRGGGSAFAPTDITGLKLWLKSDAGLYQERTGASATTPASADGDPIGTWLDQSGQANHATAAADSKRPTLKLATQNGRAVTRFDGVDDYLTITVALAQLYHVYVVAISRTATQNNYARIFQCIGSGNAMLNWNNSSYHLYIGGVNNIDSGYAISNGVAFVGRGLYSGASSKVGYNDAAYVTGNINNPVNTTGFELCNISFAGQYVGKYDIAEILVYDNAVSQSNETSLLTYLNTRWAVY